MMLPLDALREALGELHVSIDDDAAQLLDELERLGFTIVPIEKAPAE